MSHQESSLLSRSARGASFLIGLQIGSRALTFIVNQILLRFLSPELLGISSQLELYSITVLTFARESLRISLGRQSGSSTSLAGTSDNSHSEKTYDHAKVPLKSASAAYKPVLRAQEAINLAYLAPLLSPFLALLFGWLYLSRAHQNVLSIPYLVPAVYVYGLSTFLELLAEPCFAIAAQQSLYRVRGRAETAATVVRCVVACGIAAWGARTGVQVGAVPFAAGQLCYALGLNVVYWSSILPRSWKEGYTLYPRALSSTDASSSRSSRYIASGLARPVVLLALTLYGQSILKHFLTQGDSFLVSAFAALASQGIYALASNYGSLLARMLFQPVEESSRGVFASLLGASTTSSTAASKPPRERVEAAQKYLSTVLRLYCLLALGITALGPTIAPLLLRLFAGKAWSETDAGDVLSIYCYYIPLLAFNGILEAFVAATATPAELQKQSAWMMFFSITFAAAGFASLRVYDLGAKGLVIANAINMFNRILWSWSFATRYFDDKESRLSLGDVVPHGEVVGCGIAAASLLRWMEGTFTGGIFDLIQSAGVAGAFGLVLLYLERKYLLNCYEMLSRGDAQARSMGRKAS